MGWPHDDNSPAMIPHSCSGRDAQRVLAQPRPSQPCDREVDEGWRARQQHARLPVCSFSDRVIVKQTGRGHREPNHEGRDAHERDADQNNGLTNLEVVRDVAKITPGDTVLINGASGGVGSFAAQLAKA